MGRLRPKFLDVAGHYRYSWEDPSTHACSMVFPNTCAIRLSEALVRADPGLLLLFKNSGVNVCPHGYVRGAQGLGRALRGIWGTRDSGWSQLKTAVAPAGVLGKYGVVLYAKIPGFSGEGHIDLWNNDQPVGEAYWNAHTLWFWELAYN